MHTYVVPCHHSKRDWRYRSAAVRARARARARAKGLGLGLGDTKFPGLLGGCQIP